MSEVKDLYIVINDRTLRDTQDGGAEYQPADVFPTEGKSDERIEELSSDKNAAGRPVIAKAESLKKDELQALFDKAGKEYNKSDAKKVLISRLENQ